ncbi:sensor domain-containing protein [Denitromonas iodatirespirans]|uniref:EAL domain-containing protein n=1 Tax=Denitromonas iodatirespirans TaxID=2795389 RepID=A0A944H8T0_DENI1|nr:EAL domain-containing protein [Denitromonas iodatirespirans]MBT0962529.1 EAL domain-containing protein [Denitromonas iodatirespirans]
MPRESDDFFVPDLTEGAEAGLYLSLFELMNEGLIIASDETILEVNSAVCRLMERSYRDLAGQPLSSLFPNERAFLKARGALFIQGEMRGSLRVSLPGGRERDLSYVAAARIRPGVHALILSPDPVTGLTPGGQRATDTVWPRLAAALDQPALVLDARGKIMAANAPARRRFATGGGALTGLDLSALCAVSGASHESGPVTVTPADGGAPMLGRLLAGPEPGWQVLLLSTVTSAAPVAPAPPAVVAPSLRPTDLDLFGTNARAVIVTDADHRIQSVNPAFSALTGIDAAQLVGQPLSAAASGRQDAAFFSRLEDSLADSDAWQGEFWLRNRKGEAFPEWLSFNRVRDAEGRPLAHIGLFSDLSARKQAESRADYLANHDALTGLPKAHFIEARFNELAPGAQRRQQHLALVYLDIDQFKQINLAHGHAVGDQILQQLAGRLRQCSPRIQIARPGSDRFLALIHGVELLSEVTREANVLHEAVGAPFKAGDASVTLSASLGAAVFPGDGAGFAELCALTATALDRARLEGPGATWFHTHELNTASFEQAALERALTHAVSRNELEMHFQPVVDADTGTIIAAEALLRWRHPDMGLVPAHQFLPVAQSAGLDIEIGQQALRMVCAHAAEWHGAGLALPVSIGATEHMLTYGRLQETLVDALRDTGLPAEAVELNLPEACLLRDHDDLVKALYALDSLGVRIAITAIGATPLPLGRLRQRAVHRLKLDRSLIRELSHADNQCVLAATVAAAEALGLSVQGVGVESAEQQAALQALGVVRQQGRLFAAPMPADDFAQLL